MTHEAAQLYFKFVGFLFTVAPIGKVTLFCAILAGTSWAYWQVSPLTRNELLAIVLPAVWILASFVAIFAPFRSFSVHFIVFGFWTYLTYAFGLIVSLRHLRIFVFFFSLLVLLLMALAGLVMTAMSGQL